MSREWKRGDVAVINDTTGGPNQVAVCTSDGECGVARWNYGKGDVWSSVSAARPLLVIDPDDREQVREILERFGQQFTNWSPELDSTVTRLQRALRLIADPPTVLTHYIQSAWRDQETVLSLCGKRWKPNPNNVSEGKCETCVALAEQGWTK